MKSLFYLFVFAISFFEVIAQPTCTFNFDNDSKYFCPLSGGNIEAEFDGVIAGDHFPSKYVYNFFIKYFILRKKTILDIYNSSSIQFYR